MPPKAKVKAPKGIEATLKQKVGPIPLWGWLIVGVGAYYVYGRATGAGTTAGTSTSDAAGYGYDSYGSGAYGAAPSYDSGGYDSGTVAGAGATFPEEGIPLTFEGEGIPLLAPEEIPRPGRRHGRNPNAHRIRQQIRHLRRGGVTQAERRRIRRLRRRLRRR